MNDSHGKESARLPIRLDIFVLLLVLFLILVATESSHARIVFGSLQGGLSLPGDGNRLSEDFDPGPGFGAGIMLQLDEKVNMLVRIEYHSLSNAGTSIIADRGALRAAMISSVFRYMFRDDIDPWRPFLSLGFGTADIGLADDGNTYTQWDGDDLHAVIHAGAGLQIRTLDRFWLLFTGGWTSIASRGGGEATSFYPINIGIEF